MKILMLGGTTFFGKAIVEDLLAGGHQVSLFTRGHRRPDFWDRIEPFCGDRADRRGFREKMRGKKFDAVIDNIAFSGEDVSAALQALAGRLGRYILTSTAWRGDKAKREAERALLSQTRVPYTIIRPPVVLGPDDPDLRGYFYFQRILDGKPVLLTDSATRPFPLVYSKDLAKAYCLALSSRRAENQAYGIASKELITTARLILEASRALGVKTRIAVVPAKTLKKAGFQYLEPYARESGGPVLDPAKAEKELGFAGTEFSRWISDTARWYRDCYHGPDSAGYDQRAREVDIIDIMPVP